jgi:predicted dehydrogenase
MKSIKDTIRVAVIGAGRGKTFVNSAESIRDDIRLEALCDADPARLKEWDAGSGVKCYTDFEQVLNDPDIDAVCIATPVPLHAQQAIAALEAGKHVLSEVTAACTLDECWDLIAAVERTGLVYMMAENYCFRDQVLQVQNMVDQGVFGDIVYASGSYIHDCRRLSFTEEGDLTWRGKRRREMRANTYPTHSLGPVAHWLGINRTDFLKSTATWDSRSRAVRHYATQKHPEKTEYADPAYWLHPDTVSTAIRTENGVLIDIRVDSVSARPHHMNRYELQGTKASFCWPETIGKPEALIWIEGRSPLTPKGAPGEWEPLSKYREEFQHPLWRKYREQATGTGHGGGDYFVLKEFAAAVREGRPPLIDVYDAVTWSSITPLSMLSIEQGNVPIAVPNFKQGKK